MKSNFHPSAVDNKVINTGSYRFQESFYDVPCDHLAKNLLGHILVRQLSNGKLLKGKIVETECYPGGDDKASHSFQGKITERNSPMYMKPAVRLNDRKRKGLHGQTFTGYSFGAICESLQNRTQAIKSQFFFLNAMAYIISENLNFLSTVVIGPGTAVLLRAVEPLEGMDFMLEERNKKRKTAGALKPHQLANGPSKLCISMSIDKESCNAQDLSSCDGLWIEPAPKECHVISSGDAHWLAAVEPHRVVTTSRIGIDSRGKEWASKPYRFYVLGNTSVSKRDKVKEKEIGALIEILERKRQRLNSSP